MTVQFVDGHFVDSYYPTIENTFSKIIRYKSQDFATEIIDTAGQVRASVIRVSCPPPSFATAVPHLRNVCASPTFRHSLSRNVRVGFCAIVLGIESTDLANVYVHIQDEYSILNSKHFIGIHGYMIVYSVASKQSFETVRIIREKILNHLVSTAIHRST